MCDELWWYSTTYSFHSLVLQSPGICSCGSWQSRNSDLVRCGTESYSKAGKRLNRLKAETHWNALNSFSSSLCWKYCTSLAWMLWTLWTACALPSLGQNSHSGLDPLRLDPLAKGARHCNVSETSSRSKLHSCMKHRNSKRIRIQVEKELFKSFLVVFFSSFSFIIFLNSVHKQSQASFTNDVARLSVQLEDFSAMKRIRESRNLLFDCRRISEKWRTPGYSKHQCQTIETRSIPESAALLGWLTHWMWCVLVRRFLQILHVWSRV